MGLRSSISCDREKVWRTIGALRAGQICSGHDDLASLADDDCGQIAMRSQPRRFRLRRASRARGQRRWRGPELNSSMFLALEFDKLLSTLKGCNS